MVLKCCNIARVGYSLPGTDLFALLWLVPGSCAWCYWGGCCWCEARSMIKTTTTSLMVFIRQQWLSALQGSYSDWTFDVFADCCSHKKSCHLGSQWPWVLTRVMIFADYWLEPIMIIRARGHGNEVTARLRSQISPHHPVPTTQQLQQHFKNWSAC